MLVELCKGLPTDLYYKIKASEVRRNGNEFRDVGWPSSWKAVFANTKYSLWLESHITG